MATYLPEHQKQVLEIYLASLHTAGDFSDRPASRVSRTKVELNKMLGAVEVPVLSVLSENANREADSWIRRRERSWASAGRITRYGDLRICNDPVRCWTMHRIGALFPALSEGQIFYAAYCLNAKFTRREMEDIKSQLHEIIAQEVAAQLQQILGSMLGDIKRPLRKAIGSYNGSKRRCSRCKLLGHDTRSCPQK